MSLRSSAQRVQDALNKLGLTLQVVELPASTHSAAEAAAAIGCTVGQIAKSLIFKTKVSDRPVLVIASGVNRVDEKMITAALGDSPLLMWLFYSASLNEIKLTPLHLSNNNKGIQR